MVLGGSPWLEAREQAGPPHGEDPQGDAQVGRHPHSLGEGQGGGVHRGPRGALVCLEKDELVLGLSPGWPPGAGATGKDGMVGACPSLSPGPHGPPVPPTLCSPCPRRASLCVCSSAGGPGATTRALGPWRPCQADIFKSNHSEDGRQQVGVLMAWPPRVPDLRKVNSHSGKLMSLCGRLTRTPPGLGLILLPLPMPWNRI